MHSVLISITGLLVGFTVGLTGMGGGALMTPLLVLMLGVNPLTAVSSDLVTAAIIKPIGAVVHLRRGRVHWGLVGFLCAGSLPAAVLGTGIVAALNGKAGIEHHLQQAIGVALLVSVTAIVAKAIMNRKRGPRPIASLETTRVKPLPTILIGAIGGLVVSVTSVGAGSLIVVLLLFSYPLLSSKQLVSTDLWQAIPLVVTAAIGHMLIGHIDFVLVGLLLIGCVPGVYFGARVSTGASDSTIRAALVVVLVGAGLKMVGVASIPVLIVLIAGGLTIIASQMGRRPSAHTALTEPPRAPSSDI